MVRSATVLPDKVRWEAQTGQCLHSTAEDAHLKDDCFLLSHTTYASCDHLFITSKTEDQRGQNLWPSPTSHTRHNRYIPGLLAFVPKLRNTVNVQQLFSSSHSQHPQGVSSLSSLRMKVPCSSDSSTPRYFTPRTRWQNKPEAPRTGTRNSVEKSVMPGILRITAVKYSFTVKKVWKRTQTQSQVSSHSKRITSKENVQ